MVALAGDEVADVVDAFALVEAVEEGGEAAEVEGRGPAAQEVVLDAGELGHDGPEDLAAGGDVDVEEFLDGVVPADIVGDRAQIVHPADDRDVLVVVHVLGQLLEARVQVADVGGAAGDPLAVEFEDEAEGGVGRGVLRAEVERPAVAGVDVSLEVVEGLYIGVVALIGLDGVRHDEPFWGLRAAWGAASVPGRVVSIGAGLR
ncbi:hypothetical protein ABWH91_00220 [Phycisphaerales bacterium ac7]